MINCGIDTRVYREIDVTIVSALEWLLLLPKLPSSREISQFGLSGDWPLSLDAMKCKQSLEPARAAVW